MGTTKWGGAAMAHPQEKITDFPPIPANASLLQISTETPQQWIGKNINKNNWLQYNSG